ncbi:MAG TPA: hypothetical protein VD884_15465, partial [Ohtaekwangia sp.]|nr:hypothetical protein [Ohtaekwangia sp.]
FFHKYYGLILLHIHLAGIIKYPPFNTYRDKKQVPAYFATTWLYYPQCRLVKLSLLLPHPALSEETLVELG